MKSRFFKRNMDSMEHTKQDKLPFFPKSVGGGHVAVRLKHEQCAPGGDATLKKVYKTLQNHLEEQADGTEKAEPSSPAAAWQQG